MAVLIKKRLGEILLENGLITEEALDEALQLSKATGKRLGEVLVENGYLTEDIIAKALGEQYNLPYIGECLLEIDKKYTELLPAEIAHKYNIIPINQNDREITLAIVDPLDIIALDEARKILKKPLKLVVTTENLMKEALNKFYVSRGEDLEEVLKNIDLRVYEFKSADESTDRLLRLAEEAPIIQIVNAIIIQAINSRASDIHIEPSGGKLKIRFRIDGIIHDIKDLPRSLLSPIVSRIKIISDMDISEKRLPQDGHFQVEIQKKEGKYHLLKTFVGRSVLRITEQEVVDVRVSTMPTIQGEKLVLRLLKKRDELLDLESIIGDKELFSKLRKLLHRTYGMVLITGPTGSGKTTTAYAALKHIHKKEKNIITIEDPVEYQMIGVNQIQTNSKIGLTFATALKNILRQDPDIILVGEIRDKETAEIAIHAALTGHLVISTLHTNDAISTIARLVDMGIEPYLIASSITGIISQRLLRKICPYCKKDYQPSENILNEFKLPAETKFYRGTGCISCRNTGYIDRVGIYELLIMSEIIKNLIVRKSDHNIILAHALKEGFIPLKQAGIKLVCEGITTFEELIANTHEEVV